MKCHRIFKFRFFIIQLSGLLINQQKKRFCNIPAAKGRARIQRRGRIRKEKKEEEGKGDICCTAMEVAA